MHEPPPTLASVTRRLVGLDDGGIEEARYDGWLAIGLPGAGQTPVNDETPMVWLRSTAKLIQAMVIVDAGLHTQVSPAMLAIACASHTGTAEHQALVNQWLKQFSLSENHLCCGAHPPLDRLTRHQCLANNDPPTCSHHNCSGQHAALLAVCQQRGWPLADYCDVNHPLQQAVLNCFRTLISPDCPIELGVDGCNLPTVALPLQALANLMVAWCQHPLAQPLVSAIIQQPVPFGGHGRVDSTIVKASGGQVVAKVGAGGVIVATHLEKLTSVALKIASGHEEARNRVLVHLLTQWGWLPKSVPSLAPWQDKRLVNGTDAIVGQWSFHNLPEITTGLR